MLPSGLAAFLRRPNSCCHKCGRLWGGFTNTLQMDEVQLCLKNHAKHESRVNPTDPRFQAAHSSLELQVPGVPLAMSLPQCFGFDTRSLPQAGHRPALPAASASAMDSNYATVIHEWNTDRSQTSVVHWLRETCRCLPGIFFWCLNICQPQVP